MARKLRPLSTLVFLAATAGYLPSAVQLVPPVHRVRIRLDQPQTIEAPCAVGVVDNEGRPGLRIPPGVGRGWCGEAGGSATYRFYVPARGDYILWARCLWGGVCTNAVYVQFDQAPKFILGNDPLFGQWHWVRTAPIVLERGTHAITLANHSDGIALGGLLLVNDPLARPDDSAPAYGDLFYDGFDGCDGGNIAEWTLPEKGWTLQERPPAKSFEQRMLVGDARQANPDHSLPVALIGSVNWSDCAVSVSVNLQSAGTIGLCLGMKDDGSHLAVRWQSAGSGIAEPRVEVVRITGQDSRVLGSFAGELSLNRWQDLDVRAIGRELRILVDGRETGRVSLDEPVQGRVGLFVDQGTRAWFDDVHVRDAGGL